MQYSGIGLWSLTELRRGCSAARTGWQNSFVQEGLSPIRPQTPQDTDLPVFSTWGYHFALGIAEARFVTKSGPWANKRLQGTPAIGHP